MQSSVEIIPSHKIDKAKWNACICKSDNGLGIIADDYACAMPVPWRKKFGIRYCYDVPFIQQLGWFEQNERDYTSLMLEHFFDFVKYGDYAFNYNNEKVKNAFVRNNYMLDLSQSY